MLQAVSPSSISRRGLLHSTLDDRSRRSWSAVSSSTLVRQRAQMCHIGVLRSAKSAVGRLRSVLSLRGLRASALGPRHACRGPWTLWLRQPFSPVTRVSNWPAESLAINPLGLTHAWEHINFSLPRYTEGQVSHSVHSVQPTVTTLRECQGARGSEGDTSGYPWEQDRSCLMQAGARSMTKSACVVIACDFPLKVGLSTPGLGWAASRRR